MSLGWATYNNPKFWEQNGFRIKENPFYYGCEIAEDNHHPVYRKELALCSDYEDYCAVELFSCDFGVVQDHYLVFLFDWNNAGYTGYPLRAMMQVSTIQQYNDFIKSFGFDKMEDGETFLIKEL